MAPTNVSAHRCPDCGAVPLAGADKCWLCGRMLSPESRVIGKPGSDETSASPFQFSIETMLLVTTLIAVCLGALVSLPGLGVVALFIAVPALVRTCLTGVSAKRHGQPLTATDKVMSFFASAAITWAAFMAAGMAFFATCTVSLFTGMALGSAADSYPAINAVGQILIVIAMILCCVASIGAFVGMFWVTWPRRGG